LGLAQGPPSGQYLAVGFERVFPAGGAGPASKIDVGVLGLGQPQGVGHQAQSFQGSPNLKIS
jgi:hypothetical protein